MKYNLFITYDADSFHQDIKKRCKENGFTYEADFYTFPSTVLLYTTDAHSQDHALQITKEAFLKQIDAIASEKKVQINITKLLIAIYQKGYVNISITCPRK